MDLPPILYRWMDEAQLRALLFGDGLAPSWTHLAPDTRRLEKGVCLGEDAWRWREEAEYVACVALSTEGLPDGVRPIRLDGYAAFDATIRFRGLRRDARRAADPAAMAALSAEARAVALDWAARHEAGADAGDEWFLRGPLPDARSRVLAMATLCADRRLERMLEEMSADGSLGFPLHVASPWVGGSPGSLEAAMRAAFAGIPGAEPAPGSPRR